VREQDVKAPGPGR